MIEKAAIQNRIREFVFSQFPEASRGQIDDETSLVDSGVMDSMGVLEIVTFLESEFAIVLEDEEVASENFDSIRALAAFVECKVEQRQGVH